MLRLEHCTRVRRQQTALKVHLVLLSPSTCHVQNKIRSINHRKQHSKSHMPMHCRITCCAECTDIVQSASDMHASHAGFKTILWCIITRNSIWVNPTMSALRHPLASLHAGICHYLCSMHALHAEYFGSEHDQLYTVYVTCLHALQECSSMIIKFNDLTVKQRQSVQAGMHNNVQGHMNANVCKQTYDASCTELLFSWCGKGLTQVILAYCFLLVSYTDTCTPFRFWYI